MIATVYTKDWIKLEHVTDYEGDKLEAYFTQKVKNWFIISKKSKNFNPNESFIQDKQFIPMGLWCELVKCANKNSLPLEYGAGFNECVTDTGITKEEFRAYCMSLFANATYSPKEYQIEAAFNALLYKRDCLEVTTNGGKTLICYLLFKYLREVKGVKHILYVTPKTNLTTQSSGKFMEYDSDCGLDTDWTFDEIHADAKKKDVYDSDIIFGNYQSLRSKPQEFFDMFDCVLIDEAHHSVATTIRNIVMWCRNAVYKIGMTGTFPKDGSYDSFLIQTYIGPLVYKFTSYQLITDEKFATPVHVYGVLLDYLPAEKRKELYEMRLAIPDESPELGSKVLNIEEEYCRDSETRLSYICNMIRNTTKNSLVIFTDVKGGYGYKIYNRIKETSSKNIYYIDGNTKTKVRDKMKQAMEDDKTGNTIIVSSIGCFSEGIDISNLWNIFLVESTKSMTSIAQLLGRGMRRYPGKDKTILVDFGDDFTYGENKKKRKNYLIKHFSDRAKIYNERKFPYKVTTVECQSRRLW